MPPDAGKPQRDKAWLASNGTTPELDRTLGLRRTARPRC
jgi:hypothetical protein